MKNVLFSGILFIIMLFSVHFMVANFNDINNELVKIATPLEESVKSSDWSAAEKLNEEFNNYWQNKKGFLSTIVDHREIESIDYEMVRLSEYIDNKVAEDTNASISSIVRIYETIRKIESLSITNIF